MNSVTALSAPSLQPPAARARPTGSPTADRPQPSTHTSSEAATATARPGKHFSPLVQQFLDYLKLEKHFSDYTVKSYGADLIQFGQFLGRRDRPADAAAAADDGRRRQLDEQAAQVRAADRSASSSRTCTARTTPRARPRESWRRCGAFTSSSSAAASSASTRSARSARPSRKSACPSAWTWSRCRSCSTRPATPTCSAPATRRCSRCSTAPASASASWSSWRWRTWT